ncbi:MAG: Fe-S cluster assembly protein SufB, partial [Thermoplasmata archaeon]
MATEELDKVVSGDYKLGFEVDIETETVPPGLDEGTIRFISKKKEEPEWMLELR